MSTVLDRFRAFAKTPVAARPISGKGPWTVNGSDDLERIIVLPRRPVPTEEEQATMARAMTERLRRVRGPHEKCICASLRPEVVARKQNPCITELRPIQGWYLTEAASEGGVLGPIAVGGGKTGIDILAPMVVPGCNLAVLLIPPGLRNQMLHDYRIWSQHFQVPNLVGGPGPFVPGRPRLEVFAYSQMSLEKNAVWLKTRAPDVIIADEVHALKDRNSTRTGRFLRYFAEREESGAAPARFFCHSGSITTKSPRDYAHFSALALREGSPLPLDPDVVEEWSDVLAPTVYGYSAPPGKLRRLAAKGETVKKAFLRRLTQTPGVVATADTALPTRLEFAERKPPPIPPEVADALEVVRRENERPDGEELWDALEVATCARQVAAGFYLYWAFPHGESEDLIKEWRAKRKAWSKELRSMLMRRSDFLDSPKLLRDAAERFHSGTAPGDRPEWDSLAWPAWKAIADKVRPVTRVNWVSDWLMRDAAEWGRGAPGIIWTYNGPVGHTIAKLGGFPYFGAGKKAEMEIERERGERTIVASIKAHGVGRNLQFAFSRNLFVQPAIDYEQNIGRTHRPGQPAEAVTADFYLHTNEYSDALEKAMEFERYVRDTTGGARKLLYGVWADDPG